MNSYLQEIYRQTADEGYFDFTRCQRPDGTIYGSPGKCRQGVEIGAKEEKAPKAKRGPKPGSMRLTSKLKALPASDLQKVLEDPRLNDKQREAINAILKEKTPASTSAPKAPLLSKEEIAKERVRKKWEELDAEANRKLNISEKIKQEIKEETGSWPSAWFDKTGGWKEYTTRLKKEGLTLKDVAEARTKANELRKKTPWLDQELTAKRVKENNEKWASLTKEERKKLIKDEFERIASRKRTDEQLKQHIKDMVELMKIAPEMNTPDNRASLIALRAHRAKLYLASADARKADKERLQTLIAGSPKYKSTPGSTKPIAKATPENIEKELEKVAKEHEARAEQYEKKGVPSMANAERDSARMALKSAQNFRNGYTGNPPLEILYRMQGYNAKPEVVGTRADLDKRNDLIKGEDGKTLILWRGVTADGFSDQFKGGGPDGDTHYAGQGIYGNGTYAASHAPGATMGKGAFQEARSYAGWSSDDELPRRMTAFGLRSDANLVQFEGKTFFDRSKNFDTWKKSTLKDAQEKTGKTFYDVGEAAAALGIHAYRVPQGAQEDFWVVLNRGAVVAAADPQIDDMLSQ